MAQRSKYINLLRSYLPIDPNTLPETMHDTSGEDRPEERMPVVPYEGWNFMPTAYGYRSYFGLNATLNGDPLALPARCRDIFIFQKSDFSNLLIALCDTGIWTRSGDNAEAWVQAVALTDPDDGTLLEWSKCIIEGVLYVYRQGAAKAYSCQAPTYVFTEETPTTLTMAGQLGIFKAGARLGFWDSDDAIAHSAFVDKLDFTPAIGTGANITKLRELLGRIITIRQHGDGFIVYGTKSIIGVQKDLSNTFGWKAVSISNVAGIAYRNQVAVAEPDYIHYVWTSIGLMRITNFQAEIIGPEIYDFLKESQIPVYLKFVEGRYLAIQLASLDYVDAIISTYTTTIPARSISLGDAIDLYLTYIDTPTDPTTIWEALNSSLSPIVAAATQEPCADTSQVCTGIDYGVYSSHYSIPVSDSTRLSEFAGLIFDPASFTVGNITIGEEDKKLFPSLLPISLLKISDAVVGIYKDNGASAIHITSLNEVTETNAKQFMNKARALWEVYNVYVDEYISKVLAKLPEQLKDAYTKTTTKAVANTHVPAVRTDTAGFTLVSAAKKLTNVVNIDMLFYRLFHQEFGVVGETAYCLAIPSSKREITIDAENEEAVTYIGPFTITLNATDGVIADIVDQTDFNGNYATLGDVITKIQDVINASSADASAFPEDDVVVAAFASGAPIFKELDIGEAVKSGSTPADFNLTVVAGTPSDYGASLKIRFRGGSGNGADPITPLTLPDFSTPITQNDWYRWDGIVSGGVPSLGVSDGTFAQTAAAYAPLSWTAATRVVAKNDGGVFYVGGPAGEPPQAFKDILDSITGDTVVVSTDGNGDAFVPEGFFTITINAPSLKATYTTAIVDTITPIADMCDYVTVPHYISYAHPTSYTRYDGMGQPIASPNVPPAYDAQDVLDASLCELGEEDTVARPSMRVGGVSVSFPSLPDSISRRSVTIDGVPITTVAHIVYPGSSFTFPASSFTMQAGTPAPYDVTWEGAFVYDTHLKRWGKLKAQYRQLLDFSPINSTAVGIIPFTQFGIQGALLDSNGEIKMFDMHPTDSYLKFGKYGNFRGGNTALEQVRADFRQICTGSLEVETSIDGRTVELGLTQTFNYTEVTQLLKGVGNVGKWHNLAFKGQFDLTYLEAISWTHSRR